jgi:hypothetical protein
MSKKVARTLNDSRIERMADVLGPGPSSNVRATVLPPSGMLGASAWAPAGGIGHGEDGGTSVVGTACVVVVVADVVVDEVDVEDEVVDSVLALGRVVAGAVPLVPQAAVSRRTSVASTPATGDVRARELRKRPLTDMSNRP